MRSEELVMLTNFIKLITGQHSIHNFKSRSHSDHEEEHQGWPIRVQRLRGRPGVRIKETEWPSGLHEDNKVPGLICDHRWGCLLVSSSSIRPLNKKPVRPHFWFRWLNLIILSLTSCHRHDNQSKAKTRDVILALRAKSTQWTFLVIYTIVSTKHSLHDI